MCSELSRYLKQYFEPIENRHSREYVRENLDIMGCARRLSNYLKFANIPMWF